MNAYEAILEALIVRGRTGEGAELSVSLFDAMADWMTVPLLQHEGGKPPKRVGLAHTSIAPYGVFKSRDGVDMLISIQSDREWRVLADEVLGDTALATDPNFASNVERVKRRAETDGRVAAVFGATRCRAADCEACRRRHRLRARQRSGRARAASASAPHRGRNAGGAGQLSGAGGPPRRRDAPLRRGAGARRAHGEDPRRISIARPEAQIGKGVLMMLRRIRREAAEHDLRELARRCGDLRRHRADRDARGAVGREAVDAGRDRRKGDRGELCSAASVSAV